SNLAMTDPLEQLVARLLDEDEHAAYAAAFALHRGGRPALERALELADDSRPRMRAMVCCVLGRILDESVPNQDLSRPVYYRDGVPTLICLREHALDEQVRASAAAALGFQEVAATLPALCRAAANPSPEVRFGVAYALGCFSEASWQDPEAASHRSQVMET